MKNWLTAFGTSASILALGLSETIPTWTRFLIMIVGIYCLVYLIREGTEEARTNQITCHSDNEISDAMKGLIKSQGKILIMSRDLTWVDEEMAGVMRNKASSITIFAEKPNKVTRQLQEAGVIIKFYGEYGFEPKTRFTAVRYNKTHPQIAIANTENTVRKGKKFEHTIYETSDKGGKRDKMLVSLALDMIALGNLVFKEKNDADSSDS